MAMTNEYGYKPVIRFPKTISLDLCAAHNPFIALRDQLYRACDSRVLVLWNHLDLHHGGGLSRLYRRVYSWILQLRPSRSSLDRGYGNLVVVLPKPRDRKDCQVE
jgi:hypothetical protein